MTNYKKDYKHSKSLKEYLNDYKEDFYGQYFTNKHADLSSFGESSVFIALSDSSNDKTIGEEISKSFKDKCEFKFFQGSDIFKLKKNNIHEKSKDK